MSTTRPAAATGSTSVLGHADVEVQRLLLITMPAIITAWTQVR